MKETFKLIGGLLLALALVFGVVSCKFSLWHAEHPGAGIRGAIDAARKQEGGI